MGAASTGQAALVAQYNFEAPSVGDGGASNNSASGWTQSRLPGVNFAHGVQDSQDAQFAATTLGSVTNPAGTLPGTADGVQFAYLNFNDTLLFPTTPVASVAAAGEVWTMRVAVGYRLDQEPGTMYAGITIGTSGIEPVVKTFDNVAKTDLVLGGFVDLVSTYTTVAADVGKPVNVFLYNGNSFNAQDYTGTQAIGDNVRLSNNVAAVPEPASFGILALTASALLRRRRSN